MRNFFNAENLRFLVENESNITKAISHFMPNVTGITFAAVDDDSIIAILTDSFVLNFENDLIDLFQKMYGLEIENSNSVDPKYYYFKIIKYSVLDITYTACMSVPVYQAAFSFNEEKLKDFDLDSCEDFLETAACTIADNNFTNYSIGNGISVDMDIRDVDVMY